LLINVVVIIILFFPSTGQCYEFFAKYFFLSAKLLARG
jgi:hypothetical protein